MIQETLRLSHVKIDIRGNTIFSDLSLCLYPGETVCLPCLSTEQRDAICQLLSGRLQPQSGCIFVDSRAQKLHSPVDALKKGIFCILNKSALFENLSVSENLFALPLERQSLLLFRARMEEQTQKLLDIYAPELRAGSAVATLTPFEHHLLELLKAVHAQANLVVYDHDLSEYSQSEYDQLADLFEVLNRQGVVVLCVCADLTRAAQIADRIIAVRKKTTLKAFKRPFLLPQIRQCLLGFASLDESESQRVKHSAGNVLFAVRGMQVDSFPRPFDLDIHTGEIVGIIDITHRISDDILDAIAGKLPHRAQSITLGKTPVQLRSPEESFRNGILLAEHLADSSTLFQSMTVEQNIQLSALRRTADAGIHIRRQFLTGEVRDAARMVGLFEEELHAPLTSATVFPTHLARIRLSFCCLLLLKNPFSGLHLEEQSILRTFIRDYAAEGNSVAIAVSDARNLANLCTRFYIVRESGLYEHPAEDFRPRRSSDV